MVNKRSKKKADRYPIKHISGEACPRARTFMTPCVIKDGNLAETDDGYCAGCDIKRPVPEEAKRGED